MTADVGEREVIDLVLPRLQAEGYEVYMHPSPSVLPSFMRSYRPDAIALKSGKKVAVEVVRPSDEDRRRIQDLRSLFVGQSDWELMVIYASPSNSTEQLDVASREQIEASIREVESLRAAGQPRPAILLAYATLEAIGRALLPDEFRYPQSSVRLIEVLASQGLITPHEAKIVREASRVRNAVAHGEFGPVDDSLVDSFIEVLATLAETVPAPSLSP
ncbi:hypothetical protein [Rhodopseudomonas palustris]|uniref:hypothetical protein n=1 Tax=Rhodopseudomonas palustris TaxID=1076 RepID=UPI000E5AEF1B|nr:hypothetical protein [Rhodopseudomonas palustris]QLH73441.1 hypothetical protein HZF03_22600 [Rhodopseudomonas palustris]RIA02847.1 hypothetical protein D1920_05130 [Rhodopseudomonas palustris]